MHKLLKLQLRNIFHNKLFYVCLIITLLTEPILDFAMNFKAKAAIKVLPQVVSFLSSEVGIISMIVVVLYCCFDFNEGTIKNIIARGYTRKQYLFTKYIASLIGLLVMYIITIIVTAILFIKNGLGFENIMIYQIINSAAGIIAYTVLYATISIILEKNGSAIIACLFGPNIIPLVLSVIDTNFKLKLVDFWIDSASTKFTEKPTFNNLTYSILYYAIYTVIFIIIGNQLFKNKEIK